MVYGCCDGFSGRFRTLIRWNRSFQSIDRSSLSIVPVCGTAETYHHGVVRRESAISCLQADANWAAVTCWVHEQDAEAWARHWAAWVYSQEWWRKELFRDNGHNNSQDVIKFFVSRFDSSKANDVVLQARTWPRHDVGGSPGFSGDVKAALRSIQVRVLYMPGETDLYFPMTAARYEMQHLKHAVWKPMPSLWGHPAGAGWSDKDKQLILKSIRTVLSE